MSEFNATQHARDTRSGKFSTMVHAEGKPLAPRRGTLAEVDPHYLENTAGVLIYRAAGGRRYAVDTVIPANAAAAAKSLRNPRGLADGKIRIVALHSGNTPGAADISGPKDGRPLGVQIAENSPASAMTVKSGTAIVSANSVHGTTIKVAAGAEAVVVAPSHRKVSVEVEEGGKVTLMSDRADNGFTVTGSEDGITRDFPAPLPPEPETGTDTDDWDEDNTCECGEPNDNGDGWDGKCGDCADQAEPKCADCGEILDEDMNGLCGDCADGGQVFDMSVTGENGEDVFYSVNRIGDGHYELESDGDAVVEFHFNGDLEAHGEIQSAGIRALRDMGTFVYEEGEAPEQLGGYDVPQRSLQLARELEAALVGVPEWNRTDTVAEWAQAKGWDYSQFDEARSADNSHGRGAIVVGFDEVGIGTESHFGRNSWITLDGAGGTFPDGDDYDEDGWPGTMTVIYPDVAART